jgi:hypothetical protein
MSYRQLTIGCLIFATLVIPIVQLSFGFHYINNPELCLIERDIMLLMALGGFFEVIFFAIAFAFICAAIPSKYKQAKKQTVAQKSAKGNNRASLILIGNLFQFFYLHSLCFLIGFITGIIGACAIIFFVLIQLRVYSTFASVQSTNSTATFYCIFPIYSSAFGLMIATYVAFIFFFIVSVILLCGIGLPKT